MAIMLFICLSGGLLWSILFRAVMASSETPVDWPLALLGGVVFGLVFFLLYLAYDRRQHKRIEAAAKRLPSPPSHSLIVLLVQGKAVQANALFLCEDGLCLANLEQRTPTITSIPSAEFVRAEIAARNHLTLHLTEARSLTLRTAASEVLLEELKARGWLPFQR